MALGFLPIYVYFIGLCFLVSLSVYNTSNVNNRYLNLFPPFLLVTLAAEVYGSYLSSIDRTNLFIYNFFTVIEFCFYLFLLYKLIKSQTIKKTIFISIILYPVIAVVNILFFQGMKSFHTITYALGCLVIVTFSIIYFVQLFRAKEVFKLSRNPAFWICCGLLFFYCCGFPLYTLINFHKHIPRAFLNSFASIITVLNIFLYSLFTIAFICNLKIRKFTLSR